MQRREFLQRIKGNLDETRTHVLITPVFSRFNMPRFYGEFWNFMATAIRFPAKSGLELPPVDPTWRHVSKKDRKASCLFVNQRIIQTLTETPNQQGERFEWERELREWHA